MRLLKGSLPEIKRRILAQRKKDKELRQKLDEVFKELFPALDMCRDVEDFFIKNNTLIIKTKSKPVSNELFVKKSELSALCRKKGLKGVASVIIH